MPLYPPASSGGSGNVATDTIWDAKGDLAAGTGADTGAKVTVGSDGKYLKADSAQSTGVSWVTIPTVATDVIFDTKGDLPVGTGADTAAKLVAGADSVDSLVPDSSTSTGLRWSFPRNPLRPTGALYETYPRGVGSSANLTTLTSGKQKLVAIALPAGLVVTSISFLSATTALSAGTHQLAGLYDAPTAHEGGANYALLRGSTDLTSTAWSANSIQTFTLTSTYTTVASGFFYLGLLVVGTVPTLAGKQDFGGGMAGLAPILFGDTAASGLTALQSPTAVPTAGAALAYAYVS